MVPQVIEAIYFAVEQGFRLPIVYNTSSYDSMRSLELLDGLIGIQYTFVVKTIVSQLKIADIYMPDFKFWTSQTSLRLCKAKDYPDVAKNVIKEMHRQVGCLTFDQNGIAKKGVLVRHLLMPNYVDEGKEILSFLANHVSKDTYVNLMEQYRPTFKVLL